MDTKMGITEIIGRLALFAFCVGTAAVFAAALDQSVAMYLESWH